MNKILSKFARDWLKENLAQCTATQQDVFMRMYCPRRLGWSIEQCVDAMSDDKLDWAMRQVESTLRKNANSVVVTEDDRKVD